MSIGKNIPAQISSKRKSYQKPSLERVQLAPEEAVLAACKGNGPGTDTDPTCISIGNCVTLGS